VRLRAVVSVLRADPVVATAVGRLKWAWSHLTIALIGTTVLLLGVGIGAGLAYAGQTGHPADIGRVIVAALVRVPAAWVLVGIALAASASRPGPPSWAGRRW
jgi:ABC-2 type transport system permease protein